MKKILLLSLGFLLMPLTMLIAYQNQRDIANLVIDTLNDESKRVMKIDGLSQDMEERTWVVRGSKHSLKTDDANFPKVKYVSAYPDTFVHPGAVRTAFERENTENFKSLGVRAKFQRPGYNYIEIIPAVSGADGDNLAKEDYSPITIPGNTKSMSLWVWGANFDYNLEAHIQDANGEIHVLDFGSLKYRGWKQLSATIPFFVNQKHNHGINFDGIKLTKLVVRADPYANHEDFQVYIFQISTISDLFVKYFDGVELSTPGFISKEWEENGEEESAEEENTTEENTEEQGQ